MKQIINGKIYNTETAQYICGLDCRHPRGDFRWHDTDLYRSRRGQYFLAGHGGPMTMWSVPVGNTGQRGGGGIKLISYSTARSYAEQGGLDESDMAAAGFEIEEG